MDLTCLPKTSAGFDSTVVFVDRLNEMDKIAPTTNIVTAPGVAQLYVDNMVRHGFDVPTHIVRDRDTRFISLFWTALQSQLGTKLARRLSLLTATPRTTRWSALWTDSCAAWDGVVRPWWSTSSNGQATTPPRTLGSLTSS